LVCQASRCQCAWQGRDWQWFRQSLTFFLIIFWGGCFCFSWESQAKSRASLSHTRKGGGGGTTAVMMFHQVRCPPHEDGELTSYWSRAEGSFLHEGWTQFIWTQASDAICDTLRISHLAARYQFRRPVGLAAALCPIWAPGVLGKISQGFGEGPWIPFWFLYNGGQLSFFL